MQLALELWKARATGARVEVDADVRARVAAGPYEVQAAITAAADTDVVGWKIGATAEAAMKILGLPEPFLGPVYERYRFPSGTTLGVHAAHAPRLETEFLVGLGADLPARERACERAEVEAAVGWVAPGFEIVGTRFHTEFAGAGALLVADGGANVACIEGERLADWRAIDLAAHEASLAINGEHVATGNAGMSVWGHALGAVAWLAGQPALAGRGLRAGDVVMTGTCTGITPVKAGDVARADFGALGAVEVRFAQERAPG